MSEKLVIVGAGQAGAELATTLRQRSYSGEITLIGAETYPPYQRPPLSKAFLMGKFPETSLYLRSTETYDRFNIQLMLGTQVTTIQRTSQQVQLSTGEELSYDKLVLATGGRARPLTFSNIDTEALENVFSLRCIDDVKRLRDLLLPERRLVIVGGGYIGLEMAAVAVGLGLEVTVLEAAPRVLARVMGPDASSIMEDIHRSHGVSFHFSTEVKGYVLDESKRTVKRVTFSQDGESKHIDADLVLVGIGMLPNAELASEAGLVVANGIVVDEETRTSDPAIFAIGDCTNQRHPYASQRIRLESVPNAIEQAKIAVSVMMGLPLPKRAVPWFWSEQYGLKLQMVGLSCGYERCILRRYEGTQDFVAFYLQGQHILAADVLNRPKDFMAVRRLINQQAVVDCERLADETIPLREVA